MKDIMIGVDLAKSIFQLNGALMTGQMQFRKRLTRPQFRKFISGQPPAVIVVMEACGSAHYWAREMIQLGHEVKLIYLAIRNFEKGGRNVREWFAARNQFAIMFDERFNA